MRKDDITKMYEGLNSKERALLAFRYLTDTNELEYKRLIDTAPRKNYVCADHEFQDAFGNIFDMAAYWGIEYWKACFLREMAVNEDMMGGARNWDARVMGLDEALKAVCERHSIHLDAARRVSGAIEFHPMFEGTEPDAEFQATQESQLERLLDRSGRA